ncbi:MAG: ecoRIIR 2 [Alphaproteobacteria bacterium]|jgi:hypothetical protein|nr:ecoRIIR 2 [Alphaproteobacteria bacterium]
MDAMVNIIDWMDEHSQLHVVWYVKRLAANDTMASGGHQAGPYISKDFLLKVFPSLTEPGAENPDKKFELRIDSHADVREVRAVYYNNKFRGGTRDEARLTKFGGSNSPLLDPDSTGALVVFAFHRIENSDALVCHAWVCDDDEADLVEERIGTIEPGKWRIWNIGDDKRGLAPSSMDSSCWLKTYEIPATWATKFPDVDEIIRKTIELRADHDKTPDVRLMRRRECEFEIFRSIEEAIELPTIRQGFTTISEFIGCAQTILQRRKVRSGRSLELHIRKIFIEEQLHEGSDFSYQPESDVGTGKRPDFLFPSQAAYQDISFPANRLRMLAVKTTCRDRWRQIINEASRIRKKHLLTLQEGVSEKQFQEMTEAGVQLVVPAQLKNAYPATIQQHLQTLESFIGDVRLLSA